jgi:hypothetical protein
MRCDLIRRALRARYSNSPLFSSLVVTRRVMGDSFACFRPALNTQPLAFLPFLMERFTNPKKAS